jgi:hypothetical protein
LNDLLACVMRIAGVTVDFIPMIIAPGHEIFMTDVSWK